MEKKLNKHACEGKSKTKEKTKIKASGQQLAHAITSLGVHNQACMRKQDYEYASSCLENLKMPKTRQSLKTRILTT